MTKPLRTADGRPTCGFGECVDPMMAAAAVQSVKDLAYGDEGIDDRTVGVVMLCATHWTTAPESW